MSFHVYVEPELETKLQALCKKMGRKRNSVVREALREYLEKHVEKVWPRAVFSFNPDADLSPFEASRSELLNDRDDIFSGQEA